MLPFIASIRENDDRDRGLPGAVGASALSPGCDFTKELSKVCRKGLLILRRLRDDQAGELPPAGRGS
jgi:hypothetical protein